MTQENKDCIIVSAIAVVSLNVAAVLMLSREPRPAPVKPEAYGACCIGEGPDGVQACITTSKEKCLHRHSGAWLGPGTTCQGEPCR